MWPVMATMAVTAAPRPTPGARFSAPTARHNPATSCRSATACTPAPAPATAARYEHAQLGQGRCLDHLEGPPGPPARIHPVGWAGIQITAAYLIVEGFTLTGANDAFVLLDAQEDLKPLNVSPNQ